MGFRWDHLSEEAGDHVGLLITPADDLEIHVNGITVATTHALLPADCTLFPIVDFLCALKSCSLVVGARPGDAKQSSRKKDSKTSIDSASSDELLSDLAVADRCLGKIPDMPECFRDVSFATIRMTTSSLSAFFPWGPENGSPVKISSNGSVATHTGMNAKTAEEMPGLVMGDGPMQSLPEGFYFEVRIDEVRRDLADGGLAVGVTTVNPQDIDQVPLTCDELGEVWAVGFDGQFFHGGSEIWLDITWTSRDVQAGSFVGVLVTLSGDIQVFVDGHQVFESPAGIPTQMDLFPVVDLLDAVKSCSLVPGAKPPGSKAEPKIETTPGPCNNELIIDKNLKLAFSGY